MPKSTLFIFISQEVRRFVHQKIWVFSLTFFTLLNISKIAAQQVLVDTIKSDFDKYNLHHFQEKIFVHTDKANYVTGEICWFKIYNVDAYFNKPLNLGKLAYVEVLDNNNKPVLQAKIRLRNGTGDGSFFLPVTLVTGNYKMRAYTNWMKNTGADYFFEKKLVIINTDTYQPQKVAVQANTYTIEFYPEGGNLVNSITSKVAFRIINQAGKGVAAAGIVVNDKGDSITAFSTLKFGMGSFSFTPLDKAIYKAIIKLPEGATQVKQLPIAYNSGYVIHLEKSVDKQTKITVETSGINRNDGAAVFLLIHTRNMVKIAMKSMLENGKAVFIFGDEKLGDGISHCTIFNEKKQPVCERLLFKKPVKTLQIAVATNELTYDIRKKIKINITTTINDEKLIPANMSMAVYKIDSLNILEEGQDINNYLLLSADLAGTIESPEYYFKENNDTAIVAVDNLMLTQGWRRFKWEEVLLNKKQTFEFLPEINGHIVNGKITALKPGLPLIDINAYLSVIGSPGEFQSSTADETGKVKFEMKDFFSDGGGEVVVQTDNQKDSLYRVDIESPFFSTYTKNQLPSFIYPRQNETLLNAYVATQVQNTFLSNKLNNVSLPLTDTGAFYLKPDGMYLLDNYVRFTTLEEVLREYVMEVNVRKHNGNFYLLVDDEVHRTIFNTAPLVLIDGLPVFNFNKLMNFDPLKIRKLEVIKRRYYLAGNSFDGIISLSTYKGNLAGFEIDPHAIVLDYEGLQLQRDFYAPDYTSTAQQVSHLPDFRNLLYWSPKVITGETGKTTANFYSSDLPGKYAIIIQGICEDGTAGSKVVFFKVK